MKTWSPCNKDFKRHHQQCPITMMIIMIVAIGLTLIRPIQAYVVPVRARIQHQRYHGLSLQLSSMDNSSHNLVVDTPSALQQPPSSEETTTPTTTTTTATKTTILQVCGSKDCTRRGGGARLEKQIREVCCYHEYVVSLCIFDCFM